jgi:iron complex outermembrane receptor protein
MPLASTSVFLFVKGSNLLDEDARQHASALKDIAPLAGRSFHVGARAEF